MSKSDSLLKAETKRPIVLPMTLKKQLRFYLDANDMTAAQLARKAGIPKQSLSGWLSGSNPRDVKQVKKVADSLGVSLDNLMFGNGADEKSAKHQELNALMGDDWIGGVFEVKFRRVKGKS